MVHLDVFVRKGTLSVGFGVCFCDAELVLDHLTIREIRLLKPYGSHLGVKVVSRASESSILKSFFGTPPCSSVGVQRQISQDFALFLGHCGSAVAQGEERGEGESAGIGHLVFAKVKCPVSEWTSSSLHHNASVNRWVEFQ